MIEAQLARDLLKVAYAIREEVLGNVGNGAIVLLDELIERLESAHHRESRSLTKAEVIVVIGQIMEALPAIAELVKRITRQ